MGSFIILFTVTLLDFAFLLQNSNVNKLDIETIYCYLGHLYINSIMKLTSISKGLDMPNSMTQSTLFARYVYFLNK